jgi:hypothetical protein
MAGAAAAVVFPLAVGAMAHRHEVILVASPRAKKPSHKKVPNPVAQTIGFPIIWGSALHPQPTMHQPYLPTREFKIPPAVKEGISAFCAAIVSSVVVFFPKAVRDGAILSGGQSPAFQRIMKSFPAATMVSAGGFGFMFGAREVFRLTSDMSEETANLLSGLLRAAVTNTPGLACSRMQDQTSGVDTFTRAFREVRKDLTPLSCPTKVALSTINGTGFLEFMRAAKERYPEQMKTPSGTFFVAGIIGFGVNLGLYPFTAFHLMTSKNPNITFRECMRTIANPKALRTSVASCAGLGFGLGVFAAAKQWLDNTTTGSKC